jgi:hypothetical protein
VDSQARGNVAVDDGAVPLYNREFTLGSTPLGDPSNTERYGLLILCIYWPMLAMLLALTWVQKHL